MRTLRTLFLTCLTIALSFGVSSAQGVSEYMPYQGFLADSTGTPIEGAVDLTFKLYETSNSPDALWEESIPQVAVSNGAFAVALGQLSPNMKSYMTDGRAQYISVSVNGESVSPRQRIGSQAYAFLAYNATQLGGYGPSHFATLEQLNELTLQAGAGLSEAQVNALIDQRNYLSETAINALIDARDYLNEAAITVLVNSLIDARGYVTTADVNNLIDARGYVTEAEVQTLINNATSTLQTQISDLQNQVNNLETQVTNVQNNAAGAVEILGLSAQSSSGKFAFGGKQGVQAATEMCKATFANVTTAHLCSSNEVSMALMTGNYDASIDNTTTWASPSHLDNHREACQNFLYNSGDVASGTTITVEVNYTSDGGAGGGVGPVVTYNRNLGCNTARQVLCCR
jgi:hypothetical protein